MAAGWLLHTAISAPLSALQFCCGWPHVLSAPHTTVTLPVQPPEQSVVQLDLPLQAAGQAAMPGASRGRSPHTASSKRHGLV